MHRIVARFLNYAYPGSDEETYPSTAVSVMSPLETPSARPAEVRTLPEMPSIAQLPIELLAAVLRFWAAVDDEGPWMAASVCKYWRRVVLASPRAWSNISLPLKAPRGTGLYAEEDETPPRGMRRPFDLWLERSGDVELSLRIDVDLRHPSFELKLMGYCNILKDHSDRIRNFTLQVELPSVAEAVFSSLPLTNLDNLKVVIAQPRVPRQWRNDYDRIEGETLLHFPKSANTKHSLVFEGCCPQVPTGSNQLANAASLEMHKIHLQGQQLTNLLRNAGATSLTVLKLGRILEERRTSTQPRYTTPNDCIVLPSLDHLSLRDTTMDFCEDVFALVDAPNLRTLEVENGGLAELRSLADRDDVNFADLTAPFGTSFIDFCRRAPRLRLLCLDKSGLHDRHFVQALKHLSSLEELQMDCLLIGAPFMRALTSLKPLLCPRLHRMEISRCDLLQGEHLVGLARCRNENSSQTFPIFDLIVKGCRGVGEEHADEIHRIVPGRLQPHLQLCDIEEEE